MNPQSLLASAAINIGLALVVLSLFSVVKKQPSSAAIYHARRLSERRRVPFDPPLALRRFLPSVSWIARAFRVTEDEILESSGLDALIIIRLFKFGIKFFLPCSLVGLVVLLPVNYNGQDGPPVDYLSMDSLAISNIRRGSDRLWVHFTCLWLMSVYGLYLLYKEYKEILGKRIHRLQIIRHRPDQFTVLVRGIPLCTDHKARGCSVDHFFSKHHPYSYHSYQMMYDGSHLENLLDQAKSIARKIEDLRKRSSVEKHKREFLLLCTNGEDSTKITLQEEKLQELSHRIHQLQCEDMLQDKELPVAFVIFKSRWGAALAAQSQQHSHPLLWTTEVAPEPRDVSWKNLAIPNRVLPLYKIGVILAATLLTIFFAVPVTAVQGIARFEKLKKWFPPAMAVQLIPGLSSIVTGYLPSVILNGFIYAIPFAMLGMAKLAGYVSKSKEELKACDMVFYFLVGNVFFLSLLSGSLLDEIGESVTHPKNVPSHLARAVSAQGDFFITYILTDGLSGFSLEILQPGLLLWDLIKSLTYRQRKEKEPYLYSLPYFRVIPVVSLAMLIGMVYALVVPLLVPFLICYFCLGYVVYINQITDVYAVTYETCGKYWPYIHHYILIAIILMQITMIGLFGLKSKPAASICTVPLLLFSLLFHGYCKLRFYPTFRNYSIQDATENDEFDKKSNQLELSSEIAKDSYCPPFLRPMNLAASESSSTEPLVSTSRSPA
ncbi:CSC1-like protein At3g54510 isoform X1 [Syzygium oleosum]|uniref:CSC1-like protein At3g54510 isoform X1 n=1 Tax=Syzygium oleosum TaxID=219896 RepID=UPI0011D22C92|nr:CSC1-like protein At3g54510 isoform X1 [Syzygium oleosum]